MQRRPAPPRRGAGPEDGGGGGGGLAGGAAGQTPAGSRAKPTRETQTTPGTGNWRERDSRASGRERGTGGCDLERTGFLRVKPDPSLLRAILSRPALLWFPWVMGDSAMLSPEPPTLGGRHERVNPTPSLRALSALWSCVFLKSRTQIREPFLLSETGEELEKIRIPEERTSELGEAEGEQ